MDTDLIQGGGLGWQMDEERAELLAPAGNWDCLRAAVANGADAVYFGMPRFNARMRADNFEESEIPEVVRFCHDHGVRALVAFNTLVFTGELEAAGEALDALNRAGVDAVIVQDVGLAHWARQRVPGLAVHASTQMTVTSPEGVEFAMGLGVRRVVLGREVSLRELERFSDESGRVPVPLEMFVHGALCVAYSGQCLTSESLGRRSANRGECAQACRMPYALEVDGREVDLGDKRYLLSPQDLAAVEELPELLRWGVRSFKIEGRLKSAEYVAAVCQVYRKALDAALAGEEVSVGRGDWYRMEMTFSRGFFTGWMHGVDHQRLVPARFGKKRGPFVGFVKAIGRDWVEVEGSGVEVVAGDGVVFDTGGDTNAEVGGRVFGVTGRRVEFQRGQLEGVRLRRGDRVWKTSDPRLERELKQSFAGRVQVRHRESVEARVLGQFGGVLQVEIWKDGVRVVAVDSATVLERAERAPLVPERFAHHVLTFAEAPFEVVSVDWVVEGEVHLSLGEMNRLRRRLVDVLKGVWWPNRAETGVAWREAMGGLTGMRAGGGSVEPRGGGLRVLCRTMDQLEEVLAVGVLWVALDFEDVRRYPAAVELFRAKAREGASIFLATPRIQKAGEQGFFRLIENAEPDGVLVRNPGAIAFFRGEGGRKDLRLAGDFSLNVANPISAAYFLGMGLETVCVSYDLNAGQVLDLAVAGGEWTSKMEVTLHQHMPMFHMEHCVFAAFLSEGSSYLDCGRPCERHDVRLRDRVGVVHPLRADAGCRNTLFNAVAQTGAQHWAEFLRAGLAHFRVELLDENREEARRVLEAYGKLLSGGMDGEALWRGLRVTARLGVTEGTLRE